MKRIVLIVIVVLGLASAALWWWARGSLPQLDGERQVSGLQAPVQILTDRHGVPHVYAAGPEDAWYAAGLLHARDRLWQMELYRRAAYGRLSEILGEATLPIDRRFLTLGLRAAAEAEWQASAPEVRQALTNGVSLVVVARTAPGGPAKKASTVLLDEDGDPVIRFEARAEGAWGNRIEVERISEPVSVRRRMLSKDRSGRLGDDEPVLKAEPLRRTLEEVVFGDPRSCNLERAVAHQLGEAQG